LQVGGAGLEPAEAELEGVGKIIQAKPSGAAGISAIEERAMAAFGHANVRPALCKRPGVGFIGQERCAA